MQFSEDLVKFTTDFSNFSGSQNAIDMMKLSILDWISVGVKGTAEPISKIILNMISQEAGSAEAFVFGSKKGFPARSAALMNGVASHALDYDDTNFLYLGHPSVVVNSAVFAAANKVNLPLSLTIQCCLIGCEVASRVGVWLGREHYNKGFHITATAGIFGAALGASKVFKSSKKNVRNTLSLAASKSCGLKVQFGTMGKPYQAGVAASSGVEVATLASKGMISSENAFDGKYGFGTIFGDATNSVISDFSDEKFLFMGVKYKFHACCHGIHATIEALEYLKNKYKIRKQDINRIVIKVNSRYSNVCNIQEPKSGLEIKFSYKMIAAMLIVGYSTSRLSEFSDKLCKNKELISFRKKIQVQFSDTLKDSESQVTVELISSRSLVKTHDLNEPIKYNNLEKKLRKKAQVLLGISAEEKVWTMLQNENISSNRLMEFVSRCS